MKTQEQNHPPPVLDRIVKRAGAHLRETTSRAGAGLGKRLDKLGVKLDSVHGTVVGATKKHSRKVDTYVTRNPWTSIGLTAGIAFLAGVLIGRRRHDSES